MACAHRDGCGELSGLHRKRTIEVLELAGRIEAELASGRVDDADVSDEQAEKIAEVLRPAPPADLAQLARGQRAACAVPRSTWRPAPWSRRSPPPWRPPVRSRDALHGPAYIDY